jgi:hypothetical protein
VPEGLRLQTVHASDVAAAIARILEQDESGPFNLAAEGELDAADLAIWCPFVGSLQSNRCLPFPSEIVSSTRMSTPIRRLRTDVFMRRKS